MKPSLYAVAASLYLTEYTLYSNSSSAVLLNSAIAEYFGVPFSRASYIGVAFLAGFCVALLPAGLLSHRFQPMTAFFASSALLAVLGIATSLSPQFWVLVAMRFLQGVVSAVLAPQIFRIIRAQFYPDHHSAVLGTWGLVVSASALCSPLITALLNDLWGWRSFPFETVATTILAMVLLAAAPATPPTVDANATTDRAAVPVVGIAVMQLAVLLAIGIATTVPVNLVLCTVAILLGVAVVWCRGPRNPVLPGSLLVVFVAGMATNVFTLSVVYVLQQVRGLNSYGAALFLVPMALFAGLIPVLKISRPGDNRKNIRLVCIGSAFLIVTGLTLVSPGPVLLGSAALMGCAMGFLWSSLAANVLTNSEQIGFDSSLYHYLRALGAAIGVALGATMIDGLGTGLLSGVAVVVTVAGLVATLAARSAGRAIRSAAVR